MTRHSNREPSQLREIKIETNVNIHAEGSVLISFGNTKVICTATIENKVPRWMRNSEEGWVTAEYGMLQDQPTRGWVERLLEANKAVGLKKFKD